MFSVVRVLFFFDGWKIISFPENTLHSSCRLRTRHFPRSILLCRAWSLANAFSKSRGFMERIEPMAAPGVLAPLS